MKLCKLKLKNLNSFRKEVEIDFEKSPLGDASLVAITGPTGAGKTTLLDAICVALYGKTPRLSGTGSQNPSHLISHGEKEGFAEVHFIANGTRYIATWSIKHKASAKVRLSSAKNDKLISDKLSNRGKSLGSSQRTVAEEVEAILGLDFDAFRRSVMLAQGEFAAFLKANSEDRRKILEATAGIGIYDLLKQALNNKVGEVQAANAEVLDKLDKIPEVSPEQLAEARTELDRLQTEADTRQAESQKIQKEKQREAERKEDYEKLQASEERQAKLLELQPEIDAVQVELENAQRAERLRSEKQTSAAAKSDLESVEKALDAATAEKTAAEAQVKADQADFDAKETVYQEASAERDQKMPLYTNAKLDVGRAADQFTEADNRTSKLADLNDEISTLSDELTNKETEQTELQQQIKDAQTFLDKNPLPSDRQHRLNRANVLLAQLDSQQQQLETALTSQAAYGETVSSLKREIKALFKTREERLAEETNAETILGSATAKLNKLLAVGTREEWIDRKQQLAKVSPIVQRYEDMAKGLEDILERATKLNDTVSTLNVELAQIEEELREQLEAYRCAGEAVEHCEAALRSVMLSIPINQLRQHLHTGEPCLVCGATEHPFAGVVEINSENLLQDAENALANAKADAQTTQSQMQDLRAQRGQLQQNKHNFLNRIGELETELELIRNETESLGRQWAEIRPGLETSFDRIIEQDVINISPDWIAEQTMAVEAAIRALAEAEQAQTVASHTYELVSQQLETCESDMAREEKSLNQVKEQSQNASNTVADLQADIASTATRFWEFLPETFHGVEPNAAVDRFSEQIEESATHTDKRNAAETDLKLLDAKIEMDQSSLENLQKNRDTLQAEIDTYQREGEALLETVREKTGGIETEDAINAAIDELETDLQLKATARDAATRQLQESQTRLTEKRTTHVHCEAQSKEFAEKLETAQKTYFNKLADAGFDSPEAHNNAFRDDTQRQELTDRIDVHENEKHQLALDITGLRTRFEEVPFDPKALERMETDGKEIGAQLQAVQQAVGAQQQRIDDLKEALQKREALGGQVAAAEAELMRWKRLQAIIPQNSLRDFALEIMFKQMGSLANEQLKFLTSERYQLKVKSIGDLTVIDRWNANETRPVQTLSGGESFLTSLALALALADLSRGRAQLNSLFLDEGFGTLDAETLDIAIAALEGLRMQGRSIFLISHIQELTRRLPVRINVKKQGSDSSDGSFSSAIEIRG